MSWTVDVTEFNAAMSSLARDSAGTDSEIVTLHGREVIFNIAAHTPQETGNGKSGWWPAWRGVGRSGSPGKTRRKEGRKIINGQVYISSGEFTDGRRNRDEPFVEFSNNAQVVGKKGLVNYLYVANAQGKSAGFMQKGVDRSVAEADKMTKKKYQKLLDKYGTAGT